jgi:shikimate kinase
MTPERVILVGFMGSGKSSVGALVAARLGWEFLDLDAWIEAQSGKSIAELFREGEEPFRQLEAEAARVAASAIRHVVAAGGGAFARAETRSLLQSPGSATVWLRCGLDSLVTRVPLDGSRPLAGSRETMARLLAERESSYRLAEWTVDTTTATPERIAQQIVDTVFAERPPAAAQGATAR